MALAPIIINVGTNGVDQAAQSIQNLNSSVNQTGQAAQGAAQGLNQAGQAANNINGQGAQNAAQSVNNLGQAAQGAAAQAGNLNNGLNNVGNNNGLNSVAQQAQQAQQALDAAAKEAAEFKEKLEKVGEVGEKMAVGGAVGLAALGMAASVSAQAEDADKTLGSILEKQGRLSEKPFYVDAITRIKAEGGFDEDAVKEMNMSLRRQILLGVGKESIDISMPLFAQIAKGSGKGLAELEPMEIGLRNLQYGNFEDAGITDTDGKKTAALREYAAVNGIAAAQVKMLAEVQQYATEKYGTLGDMTSDLSKSNAELGTAFKETTKNIGKGAAEAQVEVQGLVVSFLDLVNASPDQEKAAGYYGAIGSGVAALGGGLLKMGADAGIAVLGLSAMGINIGAVVSGAWASVSSLAASAGASISAGLAAATGSLGFATLAAAVGLAAIALAGFWVAIQGSEDASTMSDEALENKWGAVGRTWAVEGKRISDDWMKFTGQDGAQYDEELFANENKRRKGKGQKELTQEEWAKNQEQDTTPTPAADNSAMQSVVDQANAITNPSSTKGDDGKEGVGVAFLISNARADYEKNRKGPSGISAKEAKANISSLEESIEILNAAGEEANQFEKESIDAKLKVLNKQLKTAQAELKAAEEADKKAEEKKKRKDKNKADLDKIDVASDADEVVYGLKKELRDAEKSRDAVKVQSVTTQIALVEAEKVREQAFIDARLIQDKEERQEARNKANAIFKTDRRKANRNGREAGDKVREDEAERLGKLGSDYDSKSKKVNIEDGFQNRIADIEDQLIDARENKDSAQIARLTYQKEMLEAQSKYEQDMVDALKIKDKAERDFKIKELQLILGDAERDANRAATIAGRAQERANEKEDKDTESGLTRADIEMRERMNRAVAGQLTGFNSKGLGVHNNPTVNSDIFQQPLKSFQSYNMQPERYMDIDNLAVPEVTDGTGAKAQGSVSQNSDGTLTIEFEKLILENWGSLGSMRGKVGKRR